LQMPISGSTGTDKTSPFCGVFAEGTGRVLEILRPESFSLVGNET
jgi:hypothetical protein